MKTAIDRLVIWALLPTVSAGAVVASANWEINDLWILVGLGLVAALGTLAVSRRERNRLGTLHVASVQFVWLAVRLLLLMLAVSGSVFAAAYVAKTYFPEVRLWWLVAIGLVGCVMWANIVSAFRYPVALAIVPLVVVAALAVESKNSSAPEGLSWKVAMTLTGLCAVGLVLTKLSYVPDALQPLRLFYYSFGKTDEELCQNLERHLAVLRQNGFISGWHKGLTQPGQDRSAEVVQNLEAADIILLLVSADFLADCDHDEMERVLQRRDERDAEVIPVLLRACDWDSTPFGCLQPVPTNGYPVMSSRWKFPDEAFENVARAIREVVERRWRYGQLQ